MQRNYTKSPRTRKVEQIKWDIEISMNWLR